MIVSDWFNHRPKIARSVATKFDIYEYMRKQKPIFFAGLLLCIWHSLSILNYIHLFEHGFVFFEAFWLLTRQSWIMLIVGILLIAESRSRESNSVQGEEVSENIEWINHSDGYWYKKNEDGSFASVAHILDEDENKIPFGSDASSIVKVSEISKIKASTMSTIKNNLRVISNLSVVVILIIALSSFDLIERINFDCGNGIDDMDSDHLQDKFGEWNASEPYKLVDECMDWKDSWLSISGVIMSTGLVLFVVINLAIRGKKTVKGSSKKDSSSEGEYE